MFLTGACVLIVEVLAVRVFSPYYGNTIFTVSSVITVILLALSVGYYAGGVAADRRPSRERFFGLILASGIVLLVLHIVGTLTLPAISGALSIQVGPLVSAAMMFLLPAVLLGMVSPFAIKLQSLAAPQQGVGSVAGTIFFWSTLGSITGSLLAGFVLIPTVGVNRVIIAVGIVLVLLGVIPLTMLGLARRKAVASGAGSLVLAVAAAQFATAPVVDADTIVYQSDGLYQQITIYEGAYLGRPARFLLLDRSESGAMFLDSNDPVDLVYDYTKYYSLYKVFTPRLRNALVLGGGAYSIPKALLQELPDVVVDVAEIEPSFLELAKRYFGAADSPRLRNYVEDGRRFLQDSDTQYDLIFGDVYYSYFSVPPQFTTREFFTLAKSRLRGEGVFIANMIGDLSRRQPSLIMAEIRTFQTVFPNSYFFAVESAGTHRPAPEHHARRLQQRPARRRRGTARDDPSAGSHSISPLQDGRRRATIRTVVVSRADRRLLSRRVPDSARARPRIRRGRRGRRRGNAGGRRSGPPLRTAASGFTGRSASAGLPCRGDGGPLAGGGRHRRGHFGGTVSQ